MTPLKDSVGPDFVRSLAAEVQQVDPNFQSKKFVKSVLGKGYTALELKARVRSISENLGHFLPASYLQQVEILHQVAPKIKGLGALFLPDFIEVHGLENPAVSLPALKSLTVYISAEFAMRPFIRRHPDMVMALLRDWAQDSDPHVRRLASECCRPRLPWSFPLRDLIRDPSPGLLILESLKADESLYVRKSVANHLNDISKDHPELVLKLAKDWVGEHIYTDWILKHGLRTLLKQANPKALKLFGVGAAKHVEVTGLRMSQKQFRIGTRVAFSFQVQNLSRKSQKLRVEYVIHYVKKSKGPSKKVFKITERDFGPGLHDLKREHSLRQMTTRTHYPGLHRLQLIINGQPMAEQSFTLLAAT